MNVLTVVLPADRAPIHGTGPPVRKVLSWTINLYFVFSTVIGIWRYFFVRLFIVLQRVTVSVSSFLTRRQLALVFRWRRWLLVCSTATCGNYVKCENCAKCENSAKCEKSMLNVKKAGPLNATRNRR